MELSEVIGRLRDLQMELGYAANMAGSDKDYAGQIEALRISIGILEGSHIEDQQPLTQQQAIAKLWPDAQIGE